LVLAVMAE